MPWPGHRGSVHASGRHPVGCQSFRGKPWWCRIVGILRVCFLQRNFRDSTIMESCCSGGGGGLYWGNADRSIVVISWSIP